MSNKSATGSKRKSRKQHSAQTKAEAVLAIWTERRTSGELSRELNITYTQLSTWQDRALEGMLKALEPRRGKSAEAQSNLTKSLEKLFERKGLRQEKGLVDDRLEKRLTSIQQTRDSKE